MNNALTIIDDFLPNASEVREFALSHDFTQKPVLDGVAYEHFAPVKDDRFSRWLEVRLSEVIGCTARIKIATFCSLQDGQGTQQWIHSDDVCAGSHAAVLYLFDRSGFGTSFWTHRELNESSFDNANHACSNSEELAARIREDGKSAESWILTDLADSRFNRLIFFPSSRFHSRSVEHGFGDSLETSRLVLAVFFDILP